MSCGGSGQLADELASSSWPLRIDPRVDSGRAERVVSFAEFCTVTETFIEMKKKEATENRMVFCGHRPFHAASFGLACPWRAQMIFTGVCVVVCSLNRAMHLLAFSDSTLTRIVAARSGGDRRRLGKPGGDAVVLT